MNSFRKVTSPKIHVQVTILLIIGILILWGLYILHDIAFGLFHTLAEFSSIIIAWIIFILGWQVQRINPNRYFLFLGVIFAMIGSIDLLHSLSFAGVALIPGYSINLPTSLWIVARFTQCIALFLSPFIMQYEKKRSFNVMLFLFSLGVFFVVISVFEGWFPVCYIDGIGLTPFKIISEYMIIGISGCTILVFHYFRSRFDRNVLYLLCIAIGLAMVSEFLFTLYSTPQDYVQIWGHFLKIVEFYLIYCALVSKSLHQPFETLFRRVKEIALFPEENPTPVIRISSDYAILYANHAGQKLLNALGCSVGSILPQLWSADRLKDLKSENSFDIETTINNRMYSIAIVPIKGRGYINLYGMDITKRKQAEEELKLRTQELERSNQDLEAFAYAASHDLQEPLRNVSSFVQLLAQRYQGKLDSDAEKYIGIVSESTGRMSRMISDLLEYSRISTRGAPFQSVDLNQLLPEILINLDAAIKESSATITSDPLPVVIADASQLGQVLQNLISNAIKYRKDSGPTNIHIGTSSSTNREVHLFVRDNGIGIDKKYVDKLFILFHRLHPRGKYPGTGVGLAICKKIIERHGGRIWVESEQDKGATFHFTLPRNGK